MTHRIASLALLASLAACTVEQPPAQSTAEPAATTPDSVTVPDRFHGLFALDQRACAEDYKYQPAFQNIRVFGDEVRFFENGGPVTEVDLDGPAAAITLRDQYADGETVRTLYMRDLGGGCFSIRDGLSEQPENYVRCGPASRS